MSAINKTKTVTSTVDTKTNKTKDTKAEEAKVVEEEEVEEVEEVVEEVEEVVEETNDKKKSKKIEYTNDNLTEVKDDLNNALKEVEYANKRLAVIQKQYMKLVEKEQKKYTKRQSNKSDKKRDVSGFVKSIPVPSSFVPFFLNHVAGDYFQNEFKDNRIKDFDVTVNQPRPDFTKILYYYIRKNNLYKKNEDGTIDKKTMRPDEELKKLLHIGNNDELTFSNFQTYVSRLIDSDKLQSSSEAVEQTSETGATTETGTKAETKTATEEVVVSKIKAKKNKVQIAST